MASQTAEDMQIPINARVHCADGDCGNSTYVLINPVAEKVTHVVVKDSAAPHTEYMVAMSVVESTVAGMITLRCTQAEMQEMPAFVETEYIREPTPTYVSEDGAHLYWPYATAMTTMREDHLQIPPGELAVKRGTRVEASDGHVGRVDEFLVNAETGNITHLVLREGHLWGRKDVSIPLSAIKENQDGVVILNLDKEQCAALPAIPARR